MPAKYWEATGTRSWSLYKALHLSRKTGEGQLLCALCGVAVYLCSAPDRQHFYFKHFQEDGSCPAVTRERLE